MEFSSSGSSRSSSSSSNDEESVAILGSVIGASLQHMDVPYSERSSSRRQWAGSKPSILPNILRDFEGAYNMVVRH